MKNARTGFSIAMLAGVILLLLQVATTASAQFNDSQYNDRNGQNYDQDPPARAGRIGLVEGSVSFQPGGVGDWLAAVPNRPLTVGDNLWVERDSRAEIQLGSTSIRLGPETSISFLDMGNNVTQLRLSVGSLVARVRRYGRDDTFEIDTPNLAFNVNRPGEYRLDVNQNGDQTLATVWRGDAEITGAGNSYRLMEGQRGTFSGVDQLAYQVDDIGSRDSFDRWSQTRDDREDRVRSSRYISTEMTGYEDLDDYGRWRNVGGYGDVWSPAGVPGDWAPYRYGHWVYVSPWGWTWVEDEPWGFAPFHYGRWAYVENGWCWVPGPVAVVPVYAPALVAFVGGGGFSIGFGVGGGVGWFPLGPGDVFVPWYRTSPRYVQNVNVTNTRVNVTQVTNVYNNYNTNNVTNVTYVNQRVTNSVTVVNHDTFVNARPVNRNIMRVDNRQMVSARVTPAAIASVQPERQSVMGASRPVQARAPEQALSRQVVATRQPVVAVHPPEIPNVGRAAPPAIRTVRATPPTEAQPLQRGARGESRGMPPNAAAPRPGEPGNQPGSNMARPTLPEYNRSGADNNRNNSPRPGAPVNNSSGTENNRAVPRPGAPQNSREAAPRPGAPENRSAPENNRPESVPSGQAPRPGAPVNNRDMSAPTSAPQNRPSPPQNNRQEQQVPRPPSANRSEPPAEQPRQYPGTRPESRPQETPMARPEQPPRPPETRPTPQQNMSRPEAAPRPAEPRSTPAPRPEARPIQPPPQSPAPSAAEPRNQRPNPPADNGRNKDNKDKDKEPPRR